MCMPTMLSMFAFQGFSPILSVIARLSEVFLLLRRAAKFVPSHVPVVVRLASWVSIAANLTFEGPKIASVAPK
jgi:hypothetical protein